MYENKVSYRTKQENLLKTKVQQFQSNYKQSLQRVRSSSSMSVLAGSVKMKRSRMMTPSKTLKRPSSASMLAKVNQNPELLRSAALKGLNTRVSHVPNYSDINTQLLLERKSLEERAYFLREEIAKEKRLLDRAEINSKKNQNDLQKSRNQIKELNIRSERLNEAINETRQDMLDNKRHLNDRLNDNNAKNAEIKLEMKYISDLENRCKQLKNHTLIQQKNRGNTKAELIRQQRVMASDSIKMKELEQERANLLLQINKSVEQYKLQ